jgi:DNA-binding NarL/FixJ family response regulator
MSLTVYLVGTDTTANGALSYVLEKEICAKCIMLKKGEAIPDQGPGDRQNNRIVLIDCLESDLNKKLICQKSNGIIAALFNLPRGTGIEQRAIQKGIKGFFYRNDSLSNMLKGLRALLQGEIWMSREILTQVALQGRMKKSCTADEMTALSNREIEIIALLSVGSSNEEIAEKLSISPHTVKAHLYRMFRKIKAPNRFQATLWAVRNL